MLMRVELAHADKLKASIRRAISSVLTSNRLFSLALIQIGDATWCCHKEDPMKDENAVATNLRINQMNNIQDG